jgi:hypothetical protein
MAIPVAIDLLVKISGLGGIANSIKNKIKEFQEKIRSIIVNFANKVKAKAVTLINKLRTAVGGARAQGDSNISSDNEVGSRPEVIAGVNSIDDEEAHYLTNGTLTKEKADEVARNIKRKYPVFKSFVAVDVAADDVWDYEYEASPKKKVKGKYRKIRTGSSNSYTSIEQIPRELLYSKPPNSRVPEKWFTEVRGTIKIENRVWTYIDNENNSVTYKNNFPDFRRFVRQEVQIDSFKGYQVDFSKADQIAKEKNKKERLREINTWHHYQDLKTMQEIDKFIHSRFTHRGGMALAKELES